MPILFGRRLCYIFADGILFTFEFTRKKKKKLYSIIFCRISRNKKIGVGDICFFFIENILEYLIENVLEYSLDNALDHLLESALKHLLESALEHLLENALKHLFRSEFEYSLQNLLEH